MIILGISGGLGHDAAAALVIDGVLVAMVEEERFTRVKRAFNQSPIHAILYCLQEANISLGDVDIIAVSWEPALDPDFVNLQRRIEDIQRSDTLHSLKKFPLIIPINHHISHAASSFYTSGFDEAAIIVMDGQGEIASTTIAHGKRTSIRILQQFDVSQSLGYFYSAVTYYCGLGHDSAGKTMGLAPYGQPLYDFSNIHLTNDGYHIDIRGIPDKPVGLWYEGIRQQWFEWLITNFGPQNNITSKLNTVSGQIKKVNQIDNHYKNIAASAQHVLEKVILHLIQVATHEVGCRNVVLSGGVALNCSANGVINRSGSVNGFYVFPAAHDAGGALGAALEVAARHGEPRCPAIHHAYWGPAFDDSVISTELKRLNLTATEYDDIGVEVARRIVEENAKVGWFQGRMEVGPRALGHRSILANPMLLKNLELINNVKGRELWRPLAPSILRDDAEQVFENFADSPFMLQAFLVHHNAQSLIPAVTHVDGSSRPQVVNEETSYEYRDLLLAMRRDTGLGAVINTSFNNAHEPIVCTPLDAIRTFYSTPLDILVLGHHLLSKKR